jgi:hypothetical protein
MCHQVPGPRVARWFVFKPKIQNLGKFWWAFECKFGIFYDHLEYFMAILYNLCPFGIVCGHLLYFSQFGMVGPRKICQPCQDPILPDTIFPILHIF